MKLSLQIIFLFLLIGCGINFFDPVALSLTSLKYFRFTILLIAIFISIPYFFKEGRGFVLPVKLIAIATVISFFTAAIIWDQSFTDSFKSTLPLMLWFSFFYFINEEIPIEFIEKILLIYGIIYVILYLFQFTHSSVVYFGYEEQFTDERGVPRIIFPGAGIFFISTLICLVKSTTADRNRIIWLVVALFGLFIAILQVTRQSIAFLIIIYLYHFFRNLKHGNKVLFLCLIIIGIIILLNVDLNIPIFNSLIEIQKETTAQGSKYIRFLSGGFFLTDFSPNLFSHLFGNGVPYWRENDASSYGLYEYKLQVMKGYYLSDVGIIAVYAMFGVIAVIGYILMFLKSFVLDVPKQYYYLKYYLSYLLFSCLTSDSIYSYKYLIVNVIVLFCFQKLYEESNSQESKEF